MELSLLAVLMIGFYSAAASETEKCPEYTCTEGVTRQHISYCSIFFGTPTTQKRCEFIIERVPAVCGVELELLSDLKKECGRGSESVGHLQFANGENRNSNTGFNVIDLCEEDGKAIGKRVYLKFKNYNDMTVTYQGTFNFKLKMTYLCCQHFGVTVYGDKCCDPDYKKKTLPVSESV